MTDRHKWFYNLSLLLRYSNGTDKNNNPSHRMKYLSLLCTVSCILTVSHSLQFGYAQSKGLLHPTYEINLVRILNNYQSVSLIPKMGSQYYKFLTPGSQNWKLYPGIAITTSECINRTATIRKCETIFHHAWCTLASTC